MHILNGCMAVQDCWTTRHDAIVNLISANIPSSSVSRLSVNSIDELGHRSGIAQHVPDIVAIQKPRYADTGGAALRSKLSIVDVAVPYEHDGVLDQRYDQKVAKYTPLKQLYKRHQPNLQGEVHAFVVGSLGSIHNSCFSTLRRLEIPRQRAHELMRKAAVTAIQGSRRAWSRWCQLLYTLPPDRQNPPPVPVN